MHPLTQAELCAVSTHQIQIIVNLENVVKEGIGGSAVIPHVLHTIQVRGDGSNQRIHYLTTLQYMV